MGALKYIEHYSVADYRLWQGDWELIAGRPYAMAPSTSFEHQRISLKISRQLDEALDGCSECSAVFETDVLFADDTVVRPDCMVICYQPKEQLTKAPAIIFEVLSPSTAKRDENLKFGLYEAEGVHYYALVYGDQQKVKLYLLHNGRYQKVGDFERERYFFELDRCTIDFDFSKIWPH
ncbi:MAG: Uma2 family endonuclease [Campylobacterales bacterium]|nr:Uma2 family endonuclease [Campylobacterales bacterium]